MKKISIFLMMLCFACFGVANAQSLWSENFEGGSMPSGWTTDGSGSWSVATAVNSTHPSSAGEGTYCAQIKHGTTGAATKLITPEINLSSVTSAELSFMHAQQSWSGDIDGLKVYYRTSSSGTWTQLVEYTDAYASWTTESGIVLPNLSSTYQIAFEYIDNYGYGLGIDYVNIIPGASCVKPAALAVTANGQSATLTWESDATQWAVAHSTDPNADPSDNVVTTVSSATYTMNNLAIDADHYFWVRSNCSATEQSAWAGPVSAHIGYCVPAPSSVDNSGISNVTFGMGDFVVNNNTTMSSSATYLDCTDKIGAVQAGVEATIAITFKTGYTYNTFVWVDLDNSLSFDANEVICYGESTGTNPTTLTLNFTIPATQTLGDFRLRIGSADSGLGSDPTAADPCYSNSYGCFQDYTLRVLEAPSCLMPTGLAVTTDGRTATATWDGTATSYNIDINGTVTNNVTSPYEFNVELSTTYAVKVQANCDGGETSDWTEAFNITTPDCIGGHTIEYTLNDSYGDGWNGASITLIEGCEQTTLTCNGSSASGTLTICDDYFAFIWNSGSFDSECGFTFTEGGTTLFTKPSSVSDGLVLYSIGIQPLAKPTNLTAGTPGANEVQLSWTENGTATTWQICINDDENNLVVANSNPFTLTGLNAATAYTVKVRSTDGTNASCWSNVVSFTTDSSCPTPTNVTASNVTINSAHISWDGDADNYNVQYATATVTGTELEEVFFDDFENGFGNWTTYALGEYTGDTWALTNSTSLVDNYHSGSYGALTRSYYNGVDVSVDNWLVSPQMTLGDVLKFWVVGDNNNYQEYFAVYVSTGTNAASDFVMLEAPELAPGDGTWAERTVDLSAYAGQVGYIAIRHTDFAQDFLILDDFGVYKTVNAYTYGTFTSLPSTSETSSDITDLDPETLYVAQVQADCGDPDGTSSWSSVYFTTPDACSAPTDLVSSNITATTATLGWSDNQDSYNVQYRKVYFYEGFESENLPTGWTTIDANEDGNTWGIFHATTHSGNNGAANFSYIYNVTGTEPDDYLVSPQLDLQGTLRVWLSGITASSYAEHFEILLSTTGNSAEDFTITLVPEAVTTNEYVEYTADLSSYEGRQGYIAIHHFNCQDQRYLYVDDFGLYGTEDWVTVNPNPTDATVTLSGLTPMTGYEWQVQGLDCNTAGSATDWSAVATFTTLAQYTKTIEAVGTEEWAEGKGGYYLIASPVMEAVTPTADNGFLANDYDLYSFDQTSVTEEWQNYRNASFDLANGQGYLYASKEGTTLTFTGAPYSGNGEVTLSKTNESVDFQGWNLVGNPFDVDAYINKPFYTLENSDTYTNNTAGTRIQAMQGLLVVADSDEETLVFSTVAPSKKVAKLNMNVSKGHSVIDHASISFSEGQQLPKLQFRKNSTKVYMPIEGKDYAIATAESNMGEMPVSFKAENNGSYTLSFTSEEVSFAYLHLIDNMTGNDVDLLETPSYTFEAKTTDYASRFKLVFATGNADDNFAFFSNGSFVINNEGNATLQVIDINGRMISSESINGCTSVSINQASGIYMLRLVNGDSVKVQKVVVR